MQAWRAECAPLPPERLFQEACSIARDYRVNRRIRTPIVRVIRGEESNESAVMPIDEALALAESEGLDLVEVGPNQSPPVCRLLDYGRFKFIQSKKAKEARRASRGSAQQREVRLKPRISEHDIQSKIRTVKGLLEDGAKVRVAVMFRGREQTHPEIAMKVLRRVAEGVASEAKLERPPAMEQRSLSIILSPAPGAAQRAAQATEAKPEGKPAAVAGGSSNSGNSESKTGD